jgi:polyphosphate kinase
MTRNLDSRIELMFPVEQPAHKASVTHALHAMFRDNVKARSLGPDGSYTRVPGFRRKRNDECHRRRNAPG